MVGHPITDPHPGSRISAAPEMTNLPTAMTKLRQNRGDSPSSTPQIPLVLCGFPRHPATRWGWHKLCCLPCTGTQGVTGMIELEPGNALSITLQEDGQGRDRVVVTLQAHGCALNLTPHQARVLATELIMAVNRSEVRGNLKHSQNMVRGTQSAEQRRSLLNAAFAK